MICPVGIAIKWINQHALHQVVRDLYNGQRHSPFEQLGSGFSEKRTALATTLILRIQAEGHTENRYHSFSFFLILSCFFILVYFLFILFFWGAIEKIVTEAVWPNCNNTKVRPKKQTKDTYTYLYMCIYI